MLFTTSMQVGTITLHNIAGHFGIKKAHGQFHQLDEKIGKDRDVYARTDVEQNPRADKIYAHPIQKQHSLGN